MGDVINITPATFNSQDMSWYQFVTGSTWETRSIVNKIQPVPDSIPNPSDQQEAPEIAVTISFEESSSLQPEDITSDNIMSTCSDAGYISQESCSETFRQTTQSMTLQQNLSNDDTGVDTDIYTDMADNIGMYNLDYILCQFNEFFRSRLDSELEAFQEIMHSILTEQLNHIQRIISSSIEQNLNEECSEAQEEVPVESNENSIEASDTRRWQNGLGNRNKMPKGAHVMSQRAKLKWV